jgi:hypothetical protein
LRQSITAAHAYRCPTSANYTFGIGTSFVLRLLFVGVLLTSVLSAPSHAANVQQGDLLVVDATAFGTLNGGIIEVDPSTGSQTPISPGVGRTSITVGPDGDIFVVDQNPLDGVIRVNYKTGASATISFSGYFVAPHGVAISATGEIFVADLGGGIIRVNSTTGAQAVVSFGGNLTAPTNLAVERSGNLLVVTGAFGGNIRGLVRVDPLTGNQTVVSSGGLFRRPHDITIDGSGKALIVDFDAGVIRVDPVTGAQSVVSSGANFCSLSVNL